jgi:hypothetical protein
LQNIELDVCDTLIKSLETSDSLLKYSYNGSSLWLSLIPDSQPMSSYTFMI